MNSITVKQCSVCKELKPTSEFRWRNKNKDVLCSNCRSCCNVYNRLWKHNNKEKIAKTNRKYLLNHPEYGKSEKKKESRRKWAQTNPEKRKITNRKWRQNNPTKGVELCRKWRKEHPEKELEYRNIRRARKNNGGGRITANEWKELCERYDNKCLCCGRNDMKLTLDHVTPLKLGGTNTIDNAQPLCRSCNSSKGAKYIDYRMAISSCPPL